MEGRRISGRGGGTRGWRSEGKSGVKWEQKLETREGQYE